MHAHSIQMKQWKRFVIGVVLGMLCLGVTAVQGGEVVRSPWHVSVMGGRLDFEGDEAVADSFAPSITVGYDVTNAWTIEGYLIAVPGLDENFRTDWETGRKISRLKEEAGVRSTSTFRLGAAGLYHFAEGKTVDPYIAMGSGVVWYEDDFNHQVEAQLEAGGGLIVNLTPAWAIRFDGRSYYVATADEFNSIVSAGLMWTPTKPAPAAAAVAAPLPSEKVDSDSDGIPDVAEKETYHTDSMNIDSDWDGLTDGQEVQTYNTDPLKRDTDGGGVADGHEAIEDKTNPLDKSDDVEFYALHIEFPKDSDEIKAQYFGDLDVIGKILSEQPAATVRIEGHMDQHSDSMERQAMKLSEKRAESVMDYLTGDKWKISRKRMTVAGYGFSRPQEKPDLANGNLANRRIEIYIRHLVSSEKK